MGYLWMWLWTLSVLFGVCSGQELNQPHYLVVTPVFLEAGAKSKFCASLLDPNEPLTMKISLVAQGTKTLLYEKTSDTEFHKCDVFQAPVAPNDEVQMFEVEVKGETFYSKEERKVAIKVHKPGTFVQTDKPIYLPGQTVHFRVVSLDRRFRPASRVYDIIELQDSRGNIIGQWLEKDSNSKILQLSYSLSSEALSGFYNIEVKIGEERVRHSFEVKKYVLPKFNFQVKVAGRLNFGQETIDVQACAKYTYGQPVPGNVTMRLCRPVSRDRSDHFPHLDLRSEPSEKNVTSPCDFKFSQTDKRGCATFSFKMSHFTGVNEKRLLNALDVSGTIEEEGTGVSKSQETRSKISNMLGKLSFIDTPNSYSSGSIVEGKVKAVFFNDTPMVDFPILLFKGRIILTNLTTDSQGIASFSLNTSSDSGSIYLHTRGNKREFISRDRVPQYESNGHTLSEALPPSINVKSASSLKIQKVDKTLPCDTEQEIPILFDVIKEPAGVLNIIYLVMSRGEIHEQGYKKFSVDGSEMEDNIKVKVRVTPDLAPMFQIVAYAVLPSKRVIAASANFETEKCFWHKVSVEFSPPSAVPGEESKLKLTAQPHSLCGLSAIDRSVLIVKPEKILDAEKIFHMLPVTKGSTFAAYVDDDQDCIKVRAKRSYLYPEDKDQDVYEAFKSVGLKMVTNLMIRVPSCVSFMGETYSRMRMVVMRNFPRVEYMTTSARENYAPRRTVRTFFPETWIWDLVEVGESGTKEMSITVPDTITTWETETFCLSAEGFGLAPRKNLTVFQPFFLELTLPYSIVRGESFQLKATVFNYLNSCIMIKATPTPTSDYTLTPVGNHDMSCLCANERRTFIWNMNPTVLGVVNVTVTAEALSSPASCDNEVVSVPERGRIDIVTKTLIVKAEGTEVTKTHNWLICPKGNTLTEEVELILPGNVIDGSARATVSVLGDILGRALENIDGLLRMPYGCGEQNMALLAPNIYILHYLKNTNQLSPNIKEKAFNFLTSGYQRQLNYRDYAGAFSTFGSGPGNTWLTAFVVRSFHQAKAFVYIDPGMINLSRQWLISKQRENGCFQMSGRLFNNRMKGGVSDEVTLSAYITAAFLEMNSSLSDPVVKRSLSCLRDSLHDLGNTYTTALLAYVFTLAGEMETRANLLEHLDKVAVKTGEHMYWTQTANETSASLSVEISSYILLARLSAPHTAEDLSYASRIVKWMIGQQNQYGGFSSTQDTVAALQALSLYAAAVFSPEGSSTVTLKSPGGQQEFNVKPDNKLLYQEKQIHDTSGKCQLQVQGSACTLIQVSHHYNIPTPTSATTLSVKVEVDGECNDISLRRGFTLKLQSLYHGNEAITNMVMLDIKVLTGFAPDGESLKDLGVAPLVDRVEQKNDHILVYLNELKSGEAVSHSLKLVQELPVQNLKPALVKIYDYYQPADQAETEYTSPCGAGSTGNAL